MAGSVDGGFFCMVFQFHTLDNHKFFFMMHLDSKFEMFLDHYKLQFSDLNVRFYNCSCLFYWCVFLCEQIPPIQTIVFGLTDRIFYTI